MPAVRPFVSAIIVAKTASNVLDHNFPAHDLFRRRCLGVWLWSILSVFLLLLLLVTVGLFVGMVADRGQLTVDIPLGEISQFTELTGLPVSSDAAPPGDGKPAEVAESKDSAKPPELAKPAELFPELYQDWGDSEAYSLKLGRGECAS